MEPQTCTKCGTLPEDILMLACSHDLCLNCAAERLSLESKRKPATGITCEFCSEKTQLDSESIFELQKIMLQIESKRNAKDLKQSGASNRVAAPAVDKYDRSNKYDKRDYGIEIAKPTTPSTYPDIAKSHTPTSFGVSSASRKNCPDHPEEELLYYCFDCNCECICPECVIHGKHKNHQVKTLKKSQPVIRGRLESFLEGIEANISGLSGRKQEFERAVRELTEQNANTKRLIQKSFADLKQRINNKERQVLGKCDKALELTVQAYDRGLKAIARKIEDIRQTSSSINENLRRQELTLLNFYAKRHGDLQELVKKVDLEGFLEPNADRVLGPEPTLKAIGEVNSLITSLQIDSSIRVDLKDEVRDYGDDSSPYQKAPKYQQQKGSRDYSRKYA